MSVRYVLMLVVTVLLVAPPVAAACSATVTIDVVPPTLDPGTDYAVVTVHHTFTGSPTGAVALEGFESRNDDRSSGTNIFHYPMACKQSNTYTFRAIATPTGPGCNTQTDRATAEDTITVNAKPQISASSAGLIDDSTLAVSIAWSFPHTGTNQAGREIQLFVDGVAAGNPYFAAQKQGSDVLNLNLNCVKSGQHTLTARAISCQGQNGEDSVAISAASPFEIQAAKVSGVSFQPGPNGFLATVGYAFQATAPNSYQRLVATTFAGGPGPSNNDLAASGSVDLNFNWGCLANGTYPVTIYAVACYYNGWDPDKTHQVDTSVRIPMEALAATIDLAARYEPSNHSVYFSGTQTLPPGISSATRVIRYVNVYGEDGTLLPLPGPITHTVSTGSFTQLGPYQLPSGARSVQFEATLQMCNAYARAVASVACGPCGQTADPVYLDDGNMRYTDTDPLPPQLGGALQRTYDSHHRFRGSLGRGWSTIFDRRLTTTPSSPGEIIAFTTETNEAVVFSHVHGAYTQLWPKGNTGTLTLDTGALLYRYRPAQDTTEHLYRTSDGRFIGLRDLATGRQMLISYDANGLPLSVTDSWTDLTWTIATDSVKRRITTITAGTLIWTYQYDSNDNLATVLAPGNATWRTYEQVNDRMTIARDALGHVIESHDYDASGRAINSTGPQDEIQSIEYNIAGSTLGERITRVTSKSGAVANYVMQPKGGAWRTVQVIGGCSSCGQRDNTFVYDTDGHITHEQDAAGYITTRTYTNGRLTAQQRSLRPSACDPASDPARCRMDAPGLAAATLVPTAVSITTTYAYGDPVWRDRPTTITTPSVIVGATSGREERLTYHPASGVAAARRLRGWTTGEDGPQRLDRTTTTTFYGDAASPPPPEPVDPLAPAFTPGGNYPTAYLALPQPAGLPKMIDGSRTDANDVSLFVYYPIHPTVLPARLRGRLAATKTAAGHIAHFEDYDAFGNITRTGDANGIITDSTYDTLGRPQTQTLKGSPGCDTTADPLCNTDLTTTRTYDPPAGPLAREEHPGGGITTYTYDERGRIATINRGPSTTDLREQLEYTYDPQSGKKNRERNLAFENGTWVEKRRESYLYDTHGQLEHVVHADLTRLTYAYDPDGNIASVRDETHATPNTIYAYDPADRLKSVKQTLAGAPNNEIITTYGFDLHGNLTSVTDPNGNVTTYTFDDFGQMVKQVSPVTGTTTYEFDLAGNLLSTADANGATTTRAYDPLNRVLTAVSSRAGMNTETVTWTYDEPAVSSSRNGRLTTMTDPAGTTTYHYDRRGLLIEETRLGTIGYRYDADGNRVWVRYPSGTIANYSSDYAGRPATATVTPIISEIPRTIVSSAAYLPFGPLTQLVFGNGTTQTMTYDQRYRLDLSTLTGPTGVVLQHDYTFDARSNITAIADVLDSAHSRTFGYDDLNRLTTSTSGSSLWGTGEWHYDAMGNIKTAAIGLAPVNTDPDPMSVADPQARPLARRTTFAHVGTTPKLDNVAEWGRDVPDESFAGRGVTSSSFLRGRSVTYDAAGNETAYFATRTYSPRNLLTTITDETEGWAPAKFFFTYDGRGVRVVAEEWPAAVSEGTTKRHYYTPELKLLAIKSGVVAGSPPPLQANSQLGYTTEMAWFGERPVASFSAHSDLPRYTVTDHLGTPILQTDQQANIIWHADYEPYGNIYKMRVGERHEQLLRFPGHERLMSWEGTEENYNIFRWYRAGWGRYTQADPSGIKPDINLYRYAHNSPVMLSDPLGLDVRVCCRPYQGLGANYVGPYRDHCYIESNLGPHTGRRTWGLHSQYILVGPIGPGALIGQPLTNATADKDQGGCGAWVKTDCTADSCLNKAIVNYPVESYSIAAGANVGSGRNSNTFVRCMAKKCKLPIQPLDPNRAGGWNQECPAGF